MTLAELLSSHWELVLGAFSIVGTWFKIVYAEKDHEKRIGVLEGDRKENTVLLVQIQKDIVELKTLISVHFSHK